MSTIKDVAMIAGVSIATVSNYLNRTKPVSRETEKKISDAIDRLDYTPNLLAKSLKSSRYTDVGVILPSLNDSYYTQVFQGIELTMQSSPHFLNLAFSYDIPELEKNIVHSFLKKNICGLILVTSMPNDWEYYYQRFTSKDRPLVLLDRMINNLDTTFVSFDNRKIMRRMLLPLLERGGTDVLLFAGSGEFHCEKECISGYLDTYAELGLAANPAHIVSDVLNKESAFAKTIHTLKTLRPDAILTTSELSAMGVIEALTLLGYSRTDIPVLTLGEEHWNRFTHSFATRSARRPAIQLGETAAGLLLEQIRSPKTFEPKHIVLEDRPFAEQAVAASPAPREDISILMLETPQTQAILGLVPNFENSTGISAKIEVLPHTALLDRIFSEARGGCEPSDVYMFDIPWLYHLAAEGILADITEYIKDTSFDEDIFLPGCLKYFSEFEGRNYGLPFMYAPQILYYRKDLFENKAISTEYTKQYHTRLTPPKTWKEFGAIAEFFTESAIAEGGVKYGTSIPCAYKECMAPEIYMRLWSFGGRIFDSSFRVTFNTPQTLKAYISYKSAFKYAKPNFRQATDLSVISDFVNGETAMLITYPSFLSNSMDLRKNSLTGEIGYNHIPGRTPILGGWSFGMNAASRKKDAAFAFLNWAVREDNANYFTLLGGQPAINSIFENDELIKLHPWLPLYHSAYKYTEPIIPPYKNGLPIIPQESIDSEICKYASALIDDKLDVTKAIQKTQESLEKLFLRYGY